MVPLAAVLAALLALPAVARAGDRDAPASVRLIWFGRTGGVSAHVGRNDAVAALLAHVDHGLESVHPIDEAPEAFAHGGRLLFLPGGASVARFRGFLAAGPITREVEVERLPILMSPFEVVLEMPAEDGAVLPLLSPGPGRAGLPAARPAHARLVSFRNAVGSVFLGVELPGSDAEVPLPSDPARWEVRFAQRLEVSPDGAPPRTVVNIGRPLHEGARRVATIRALREEAAAADRPVVVLAAGDDIEDYSFITSGEPDRQRPHTWNAFGRIGLDVLVPGRSETALGLGRLVDDAQSAGVRLALQNLDPPDGGRASPELPGWQVVEAGAVRILVVGLVDPSMDGRARAIGYDDRTIGDPVAALRKAVAAARATPAKAPDLVVALGVLEAETRARVGASGLADVVLADFSDRGFAPQRVVEIRDNERQRALTSRFVTPVETVRAGRVRIGVADLEFRRGPSGRRVLTSAQSYALPVTGELEADPDTAWFVQDTRQRAYQGSEGVVLDDLGPVGLAEIPAAGWRRLTARLVQAQFDAEIALLPQIPVTWPLLGATSRLQAAANLNVPDDLVVVWVRGDRISALAKDPALASLSVSGLLGSKVRGHAINAREWYRVVTTDVVRADPRFRAYLEGRATHLFSETDGRFEIDWEGDPVKIRDAVLAGLDALPVEGRSAAAARLLGPEPAGPGPRWTVHLDAISLELSGYTNHGDRDAYTNVPETRIATEEYLGVATSGALILRRDGDLVDWVNSFEFAYEETRFTEGDEVEGADRIHAESELQIHAWRRPWLLEGTPFTNTSWNTEFTPTPGNPRRKRLDGTTGLLWAGDVITEWRIGLVYGRDFANDDGPVEVGFMSRGRLQAMLGDLILSTEGELRYYLPDDKDDDTLLGVIAVARGAIDAPVSDMFAFGLFADVFGYRGKLQRTSSFGASIISGLRIRFDRFWKPGFERL
jgi:hypothetical protein